ncbi:MAG: D-alanyl-D-alanine carboxypeptidase [Rothia sp. (in: high G+C Gram-positive bacteria)]|nr:D-alanyl-D-alanine carboxypeptidase [Rothia sp. (in: high G+C Gram-positive bacteria)]
MSESEAPRRRGRNWWLVSALLLVGCVGAGTWAVPTWLQAQQLRAGATAPAVPTQAPEADTAGEGQPVDAAALSKDAAAVLDALGQGSVSAQVTDAATGQVLYSKEAAAPRVPASNMKMLVDYAVLATDAQARFKTSVTQDDSGTLTLVAGGDTLLVPGESNPGAVMGHAGIATLAQKTVQALKEQGANGQLTVNLDTSIFAGPTLNEDWAQEDIDSGFITAVTPLAFFSHYAPSSDPSAASTDRPSDAPEQVHQSLIAALNKEGQGAGLSFVAGQQVASGEGAREVASVESATVAQQSALMMQQSDNSLAEVLGRNLSVLRGGDGSQADAIAQICAVLEEHSLPTDYQQTDVSGLSMNNRVSNELLTELALRAVKGDDTERLALAGLPVAGYTGTLGLGSRFNDPDEAAGRGYVRAKTGTLNSVLSLTGYTVTEGERVLVFSVVMNDLDDAEAAKSVMDRFAATLTSR